MLLARHVFQLQQLIAKTGKCGCRGASMWHRLVMEAVAVVWVTTG